VKKWARVLSCCSNDGRIERKNDSHDFWLIVCLNGNPLTIRRLLLR
jgi:hypothetical protein